MLSQAWQVLLQPFYLLPVGMDAVLMEYLLHRVQTTWDAHNITVTFK